jgi:hypothetical protein
MKQLFQNSDKIEMVWMVIFDENRRAEKGLLAREEFDNKKKQTLGL